MKDWLLRNWALKIMALILACLLWVLARGFFR
jgi:YbbR domain-containing protein